MRLFLYRLVILFLLAGLIVIPVLSTAVADIRRAESALVAGRPLDAAAAFEHAALFVVWRADLWERAGHAALAGDNLAESVRLLSQARTLSAEGWSDLGMACYRLGRFDESVRAFQRGLEIHGANASLFRGLALALDAQADFEGEISAWHSYVALVADEAATRHRLGLLLALFDPETALSELMLSAKLDKAYDPAVQTIRSALNLASLESDEARRLLMIGRGLGLVQEWVLAQEAFQRAVSADTNNADAWAWLGEAKQHLGQDGGEELVRALALDPFSANVRALDGLYWKRVNEPQKALAQFQWAAVIEPDNPAFQAALGDAYAFAGDLPPALTAYQRAAELAPTDPTYWRLLATFSGQYMFRIEEVGIPAAEQVLALVPDEAASYDLLGWIYLNANVPELAEENFLAALNQNPDYAAAHLHLGVVYLQLHKMENAREQLLLAQALDPDGSDGLLATQLLSQYFP